MSQKEEYIDRLLNALKALENSVVAAKEDDTLSFSFFKESFKKSQEITSLIHELEMLQIEDMKSQMEKLIDFLSENKKSKQAEENKKQGIGKAPLEPVLYAKTEERVVLPTYANPLAQSTATIVTEESKSEQPPIKDINNKDNTAPSINDTVSAPSSIIDVRKGLSLNDRFFFQRELFNNDRESMSTMMLKLNALDNVEMMEEYLRNNTSWNFDDEIVKSFLEIISRATN